MKRKRASARFCFLFNSGHMKKKNRKKGSAPHPKVRGGEERGTPMKEKEVVAQVKDIAESLCETEGIELVHVEYQWESHGCVLRLYIDKPGGVILDDCAAVSRQMNDLLDVSLQSCSSYQLEVTSPGTDRPLVKEEDFQRFAGNTAVIRTDMPIDGKKKIKGVLKGITDGAVQLIENEKTITIPYQAIVKARLVNYSSSS
jgi:ribosome maturation factor RimP